ncbi:hypothetical protein D9M72_423590 [compost metagenome]
MAAARRRPAPARQPATPWSMHWSRPRQWRAAPAKQRPGARCRGRSAPMGRCCGSRRAASRCAMPSAAAPSAAPPAAHRGCRAPPPARPRRPRQPGRLPAAIRPCRSGRQNDGPRSPSRRARPATRGRLRPAPATRRARPAPQPVPRRLPRRHCPTPMTSGHSDPCPRIDAIRRKPPPSARQTALR